MDGLMLCSDTAKDDFKGPSINGWLMVVAYHSVLSFSQPLDGKVRSGINTQISFMGDPQLQHTTIFFGAIQRAVRHCSGYDVAVSGYGGSEGDYLLWISCCLPNCNGHGTVRHTGWGPPSDSTHGMCSCNCEGLRADTNVDRRVGAITITTASLCIV